MATQLSCLRLADLMERHPLRGPLRGRKRLEARIWSDAVRALAENPRPPRLPKDAAEIRLLKRYGKHRCERPSRLGRGRRWSFASTFCAAQRTKLRVH